MARKKITERIRFAETAKIAGNTVRDVVLLGLESKNGRSYAPEAVKEAVKAGLYNTHIYVDHVTSDEMEAREGVRTFRDLIGVARNARYVDGKVVADIKVFASDPMGAKFLEAAADPDLAAAIGMSHDAVGEIEESSDGRQVVTKILRVESTDAVTRPATTQTLYEQERTVAPGLKEAVGSRVRVQAGEGEQPMEGTVVGEMLQVRGADGEIRMFPKEQCLEMADEPDADEEPAAPAEEADEETTPPEEGKPPMTDQASLRRKLAAVEAENATLREANAKATTANLVAARAARMTPAMAALLREEFAGKVATAEQIDAFVSRAAKIVEAHTADTGGKDPDLVTAGADPWTHNPTNHDNDDAALIAGVFGKRS